MSQNEWVLEQDISGPGGEAEREGWLIYKMQIIGKRGCADRWHFRDGELVIIEYKKEDTGRMSGNQKKRKKELAAAGFKVHTVCDYGTARRLLRLGRYA